MTDPARVGELLPGVLQEVIDRAGHGYERWAELVAQAGYCHHPIRLAGRVEQADRTTGEVRTVYDSGREPEGVLLKACGTRRESRCPSCAAVYRADAYQLLAAGLCGARASPSRWRSIRGCSSPSPPPPSAACTAGGHRGGWCCPAPPPRRPLPPRHQGGLLAPARAR
jgi:hypothetical protein